MKMNRDIKARWIEALRSGDYPQTREALHRTEPGLDSKGKTMPPGFCCLGVLCELAAKEGVITSKTFSNGEVEYDGDSLFLPAPVHEWAELVKDDGLPLYTGDVLVGEGIWVSSLNDKGKTFEEIADVVEEKVEDR